MNEAFSPYLRTLARGVADDLGIAVEEGVYAGVVGPSSETPAEVRMLASLGVSFVGMSTVCEVIEAQALGMNVLGLTMAANYSGEGAVSHEAVLEGAQRHAEDFESLVRGILRLL
jgi:purine-nucleoside phosphorylase